MTHLRALSAHACKAKVLLTGDLRDFGFLMNAPELADGLLIQTVADFLGTRIHQRLPCR